MNRRQLNGTLFEMFVLKLVLMSGYRLIGPADVDKNKVRIIRKRFIEFKGRGEYHQIDIPVDLIYKPSFIYPIRLLGEVKYHTEKIDKSFIRQEIGKMKDIQENYFVNGLLTEEMRRKRRLEVFAFFSSSGFNEPAERLAYAHGIKTVSYQNNKCIRDIVSYIRAASKAIYRLTQWQQDNVLDKMFHKLILQTGSIIDFSALPGFSLQKRLLLPITTSILGTTSTGLVIHFISNDPFPDELFVNSDYAFCKVRSPNSLDKWHLEINHSSSIFYFSMPEIIKAEKFVLDGNVYYPKKQTELDVIHFNRVIEGKQRNLEFRFDNDWFESLTRRKTIN